MHSTLLTTLVQIRCSQQYGAPDAQVIACMHRGVAEKHGLLQLRLHITHLLGQAGNLGLQVVTLCGCCLDSLFCLCILASLGLLQYQTRLDTL